MIKTSSRMSLALTACIILALYGAIIGNWIWSTQEVAAATQSPTIDVTTPILTVDIADLFYRHG